MRVEGKILHSPYMKLKPPDENKFIKFKSLILLVPPTRIERVTLPLGGGCSIH